MTDDSAARLVDALRRIHRPWVKDKSMCACCVELLPCPTLVHVERHVARTKATS